MAILTAGAIESYKKATESMIAYARYKIGANYYSVPIHRRERMPDGRVAVYFSIEPQAAGSVTITEAQLIGTSGQAWASKSESLVIDGAQTGILYRFTFDFKEAQE